MRVGRVLYPTDFSADSIQAIDYAVDHCLLLNMELIILYTYRLISHKVDGSSYSLKRQLDAHAKNVFQQLEYEKLKGKSLSYQLLAEVGFIDDRIAYHIQKSEFDNILLCKSMHQQLEHKMDSDVPGMKKLYELSVIEV